MASDSFFCPITEELMKDPVIFNPSGISFERSAIEKWLKVQKQQRCPVTRKEKEGPLIPNVALRQAIQQYKQSRGSSPSAPQGLQAEGLRLKRISSDPSISIRAVGEVTDPQPLGPQPPGEIRRTSSAGPTTQHSAPQHSTSYSTGPRASTTQHSTSRHSRSCEGVAKGSSKGERPQTSKSRGSPSACQPLSPSDAEMQRRRRQAKGLAEPQRRILKSERPRSASQGADLRQKANSTSREDAGSTPKHHQGAVQSLVLGRFEGPTGVAVDSEGSIYVVDRENHQIKSFCPQGLPLRSLGRNTVEEDNEMNEPCGLLRTKKGNMLVADRGRCRVFEISSEALVVRSIGCGFGSGAGQFITPFGIATDRNDDILVADKQRLQLFSGKDGSFLRCLRCSNSTAERLSALATDSQGLIYLADKQQLEALSTEGSTLFRVSFAETSGEGQLTAVGGLVLSGGHLIVSESRLSRLLVFDTSGNFIAQLAKGYGRGQGHFNTPRGLAVDAAGNIYVAEAGNHRVQKLSREGSFIQFFGGGEGLRSGYLHEPRDVLVDHEGNVAVCDTANGQIELFGSDGQHLHSLASVKGAEGPQINVRHPTALAIDPRGNLVVVEDLQHQVQIIDRDLNWARVVSKGAGKAASQLFRPCAVCITQDGRIIVCDTENHRLQVLDPSGDFLQFIGNGKGAGEGQMNQPCGVTVDREGNILVADTGNDRVLLFTPHGRFSHSLKGRFDEPYSVAVNPVDGSVAVSEHGGHRIQILRGSGGSVKLGKEGSGPLQFCQPMGVVFDKLGNLIVADTGNKRVQILRSPSSQC